MRTVLRTRVTVATVALGAVVVATAPATAQVTSLETLPDDLSAFILPIEATIVALEAGTATTTSVDEVAITLEADVFFEFDEAELLPDAEDLLDDVADEIAEAGVTELRIGGHTDSVGTDAYNQDLSERRAESVEAVPVVAARRSSFATEGFAAREPVARERDRGRRGHPEGRALNRRVELRYTP